MSDGRFTLSTLRTSASAGDPVAMLTCYDYTTATLLQQADVPMLLVGDSAGSVILGHSTTLPTPLDFMVLLTAAVRRGAPRAMVVGDMPFGSYQVSTAQGVRSVCRMLQETGCDAVKIETGVAQLPLIRRLADSGVAVIAHLGLRPQSVGIHGGYRYQGRTADEACQIVRQAERFTKAGAVALLLEAVPNVVSECVVRRVGVPVIGCGAGPACHAHVVVLPDLLRQTSRQPKFVPRMAELRKPSAAFAGGSESFAGLSSPQISSTSSAGLPTPTDPSLTKAAPAAANSLLEIARRYVEMVRSRAYPLQEHGYEMPQPEQEQFLRRIDQF